jgi:hypothetical protein
MEYEQLRTRNPSRGSSFIEMLAKPYLVTRPLGQEGAAKISAFAGLFLYSLVPEASEDRTLLLANTG